MTNPDRVAFTLFGKDIYWYGILMAIGIVIAVVIAQLEEKRKKLPKDIIIDLCLVIIPAGVIGARLYYVLFQLQEYLADPIRILYIWEGGLAIYGAVIGGLIAVFVFARVRKVRFLALVDCIAPGLVLESLRPRLLIDREVETRLPIRLLARQLLAHPLYHQFVDGAPGLEELVITRLPAAEAP